LLASIAENIDDPRRDDRIRYTMTELLRECVYAMALGYQAQDDLDRLAHDPAFRVAVWDRPRQNVINERLASQPTQSRLINILTASPGNLDAVRKGLAHSIERHIKATHGGQPVRQATIDIDSFPIEIHGKQKGATYNGYYKKTVYHPLVASFSVGGDYDSGRNGKPDRKRFLSGLSRGVLFKPTRLAIRSRPIGPSVTRPAFSPESQVPPVFGDNRLGRHERRGIARSLACIARDKPTGPGRFIGQPIGVSTPTSDQIPARGRMNQRRCGNYATQLSQLKIRARLGHLVDRGRPAGLESGA
jgi:hypothetical protein